MLLDEFKITDDKPGGFMDVDGIEYVVMKFSSLEFNTWGLTEIKTGFQLPKYERDLSKILFHFFTEILPIAPLNNTFQVGIPKKILQVNKLVLSGKPFQVDREDGVIYWYLIGYRRYLKGKKNESKNTHW